MDYFLKRHKLSIVTQRGTDNLNAPTSIKDIKSIIKMFHKKEATSPDGFTGEFYQTFKKEIIPIIYNIFQKIKAEGKLSNSFYEAELP